MKKLLTMTLMLTVMMITGCTMPEESVVTTTTTVESVMYFAHGRYYFNADLQGQVVTDDGNVWEYTQDIISDEPSYHNEPVIVCFDDNGTADDIYDDSIIGLVLDRETAIYDDLEASLSESFELERDGNNIRIQSLKVVE